MNNTFQNYIKVTGFRSFVGLFKFPWQVEYVYMDSIEYFADKLLVDHGIKHAKFKDMVSQKNPDKLIIFIKIPKKYESEFLLVMEELKNKCLLCGFTNYEKECSKFFGGYKKFIELKNNK